MNKIVLTSIRAALFTILLTGFFYPTVITWIGELLFRAQASGSPLILDNNIRGSTLLAQAEGRPTYFQPRPSATGYHAAASAGSNLSPSAQALRARIEEEAARLTAENPGAGPIPIELLTTSGSGLDPHLSPTAARWQVARVARARSVPAAAVEAVLAAHTEGPQLGLLGEPRVNVLRLNLALDAALGAPLP